MADEIDRINEHEFASKCHKCGRKFEACDRSTAEIIRAGHERKCTG